MPSEIHSSEELWQFLRSCGIVIVAVKGNEVVLLRSEGAPIRLTALLNEQAKPLHKRREENRTTVIGFPRGPSPLDGYSLTGGIRQLRPIRVPKDDAIERGISDEINRLTRLHRELSVLFERVKAGADSIPPDLAGKTHGGVGEGAKAREKSKRKQWKGTRSEFGEFVRAQHKKDALKKSNSREFRSLRDASRKLFRMHEFPDDWNWTEEKCYYVVTKPK